MQPPMILPSVVMSGLMSYSACAPPYETRNPVITSSKISSAPDTSQISRSPARKPSAGGTHPMFPATGSTMMAATSSLVAARVASTSLYGTLMVSSVTSFGTPAESGTLNVAPPDPALTSSAS